LSGWVVSSKLHRLWAFPPFVHELRAIRCRSLSVFGWPWADLFLPDCSDDTTVLNVSPPQFQTPKEGGMPDPPFWVPSDLRFFPIPPPRDVSKNTFASAFPISLPSGHWDARRRGPRRLSFFSPFPKRAQTGCVRYHTPPVFCVPLLTSDLVLLLCGRFPPFAATVWNRTAPVPFLGSSRAIFFFDSTSFSFVPPCFHPPINSPPSSPPPSCGSVPGGPCFPVPLSPIPFDGDM